MRKFTLLVALLLSCAFTFAQSIEFTREGSVVASGSAVTVTEINPDKRAMDPELLVVNNGQEALAVTLKVTTMRVTGGFIGFCGFEEGEFGNCIPVNVGTPVSKTMTLAAGASKNPDVELQTPKDDVDGEVMLELIVGDNVINTITVNFLRGSYNSINSLDANTNVYFSGNEFSYHFNDVANRQLNIYNVTGSLVKSVSLETEGTVAINSLNKGVYIYEVQENGKRIAAHKCVIR